jgi:hypothetical protein
MAQTDSVVSICNIGLIALGELPIDSLDDPYKRAALCRARYDDIRRAVLRGHPWNCARKRAVLPLAPAQPLFGWRAAFQLPADFLRVVMLEDDDLVKWEIEGDTLLANTEPPANLIYIWDLQDTTKFDALLVQAIGKMIAAELAEPLTQSDSKVQGLLRDVDDKTGQARSIGSQESSPPEWDVDRWLRARW